MSEKRKAWWARQPHEMKAKNALKLTEWAKTHPHPRGALGHAAWNKDMPPEKQPTYGKKWKSGKPSLNRGKKMPFEQYIRVLRHLKSAEFRAANSKRFKGKPLGIRGPGKVSHAHLRFRADLGFKVRSAWEANFARILK